MSQKYKIYDDTYPYFVTSTVIQWIDLFTRNKYRDIIINSLKYCRKQKGLLVFSYCIMTNHIHLILASKKGKLQGIVRDFKSYSSHQLHKTIENNETESRKNWILKMMTRNKKNSNRKKFQLWQYHYHPIELNTKTLIDEKMNYIHMNPVKSGFVNKPEDYLYSSARNFAGLPAVMELDTQI